MRSVVWFCTAHPMTAALATVLGIVLIAWTVLALRIADDAGPRAGPRRLDALALVQAVVFTGTVTSALAGA